MMRRILKPEETRHTELVARMSAQELLDDEATALKYGEIQRRLRTATGAVVCSPEVLEAHARSEYINPTQHGTCNHCQCRMLVYQAGQRYYSLQHSLWMEASGTVYVCATSGQAHVCDGLSCPYARRMDTTGGTMQCTITGVFATAIVYGEDLDDTGTFDPGVLDAGAGEARPRTKRRRTPASSGGIGGRVMDLRQDSDRRAHVRVFIEQLVY